MYKNVNPNFNLSNLSQPWARRQHRPSLLWLAIASLALAVLFIALTSWVVGPYLIFVAIALLPSITGLTFTSGQLLLMLIVALGFSNFQQNFGLLGF